MSERVTVVRGIVEEALARAIVHIDAHEHCEVTVFEGMARFESVLVGPPGRLHGGLHLAARTFSVLAALDRHAKAPACPTEITLSLGKPIPLLDDIGFDGALVTNGASFTLETRFLESARLMATARSLSAFTPPAWLDDEARRTLERQLGEDARQIRVFGVPFSMSDALAYVSLPVGCHDDTHDFSRYLLPDGRLGPTWLCAALDTLAAVGLGLRWDNHLFTTRASLTFDALPITHDETLVLIARLDHAVPVVDSAMASVTINGRELCTTRVPVLFAKRDGLVPIAWGEFELHPVDPTRFAARVASTGG